MKSRRTKKIRSSTPSLEGHLVLNRYLCNLLGKDNFAQIRKEVLEHNVKEGIDSNGRTYFFHYLCTSDNLKISIDDLEKYDRNIITHLKKINRNSPIPITLKYFQYFAALFTEIYLDKYFKDPIDLLNDLQSFIKEKFASSPSFVYSVDDLRKLAFWMATGSGKTHIFHLNYYQFLHYNQGPNKIDYDNIFLITPSDYLSDQHIRKLREAGIPCQLFDQNSSTGLFSLVERDKNIVNVISIHKLTENKTGGGISVDVEELGPKNLIFVDEGHKGSGGRAWRDFREKISREGWTFEYSATFGQAVESNNELLEEYGKAILFDYSYPYFYNDGYGKDWEIINLKEDSYSHKEVLLLVGLLTYYEQLCTFEENLGIMQKYNIQKPLFVFVGHTVREGTASHSSQTDRATRSDIITIIDFLAKFLSDRDWAKKYIKNILINGNSGLIYEDESGKERDICALPYTEGSRFSYIRKKVDIQNSSSIDALYDDILKRVFGWKGNSKLQIVDIKKSENEIGLSISGPSNFFGIITVGDKRELLNEIGAAIKGASQNNSTYPNLNNTVEIKEDIVSNSLFNEIENQGTLNILIGAKKFIEGWDSWRVSTMGLLKVGMREGTQIIQLFGRGVRLMGLHKSLKRSTALKDEGPHPPILPIVETLRIFGLEADYLEKFRESLQIEGILDVKKFVKIIPQTLQNKNIVVPIEINEGRSIEKLELPLPVIDYAKWQEEVIILKRGFLTPNNYPEVDLMGRVSRFASPGANQMMASTTTNQSQYIPGEYLSFVDWNRIYFEIIRFKHDRELYNLVIQKNVLRDIISNKEYVLLCNPNMLTLKHYRDIFQIEEIIIAILKKYIQKYVQIMESDWGIHNINVQILDTKSPNLDWEGYQMWINEKSVYLNHIRTQIENAVKQRTIYQRWSCCQSSPTPQSIPQKQSQQSLVSMQSPKPLLENVYFSNHLYQPLLVCNTNDVLIQPTGLNEGEKKFVDDLSQYWMNDLKNNGVELYLLRNLPKRGIGFPTENGMYYPDFILWVKYPNKNHIIFVDPKGLGIGFEQEKEKIELANEIKKIENEIKKQGKIPSSITSQIVLDSYIVSTTSYNDVSRNFENKPKDVIMKDYHVVFQEDSDYIKKIITGKY